MTSTSIVKPNAKLGLIVAILTAAAFGFYPPASRAAYADGANAIFIIFASLFFRGLSMILYCRWKQQPLFAQKNDKKEVFLGGFLQAVSVSGVIGALAFMQGPLVLITLFIFPLILLFYLIWRKEEKFNGNIFVVTLFALLGLSIVLDVWRPDSNLSVFGVGLAFLAALATAFRIYVYSRQLNSKPPFVVGAENFLLAFLFVMPLLFWQFPVLPQSLSGWAWAAGAVASLVLGSFGMFLGIALTGSFTWSLLSKLEPIFVALYSAFLINEYLKPSQYAGMGLVLASLVAYQFMTRKKGAQPQAVPAAD